MPNCIHQKCQREDLPCAAAFPPRARIACAHVRPDGEPCTESPSTDIYDAEVLALVVQDDALWDSELRGDGFAEPAPTHVYAGPAKVGAAIVSVNAKGDFVLGGVAGLKQYGSAQPVDGDQAAAGAVEDVGSRIDARSRAGSNPAVDPIIPPAKPAKPARKRAAKRAARADEDDIDDWEV